MLSLEWHLEATYRARKMVARCEVRSHEEKPRNSKFFGQVQQRNERTQAGMRESGRDAEANFGEGDNRNEKDSSKLEEDHVDASPQENQ